MTVPTSNLLLATNKLLASNAIARANLLLEPPSGGTFLISTFAGNHTQGFSGDGGPATSAQLSNPAGACIDPTGKFLIVCDLWNNRIRAINMSGSSASILGVSNIPAGDIQTIAGSGPSNSGNIGYSGDGGAATSAVLGRPCYCAFDASGNLYFADQGNNAIRKISATGTITTPLGGVGGTGEGNGVSNQINCPAQFVLTSAGTASGGNTVYQGTFGVVPTATQKLYIQGFVTPANNGWFSVVSATSTSVTVNNASGVAETHAATANYAGFAVAQALFIDAAGNIYIADTNNNQVKVYNAQGTTQTFFGVSVPAGYCSIVAGSTNAAISGSYQGDGGLATSAGLYWPLSCRIDSYGTMWIADYYNNAVRTVTPGGIINTAIGAYSSYIVSAVSAAGGFNTYTYTIRTGVAPTVGSTITIQGCTSSTNNCTRQVSSVGPGTFTVAQASGVTESETGATAFGGVQGYTPSGLAIGALLNQPFDVNFDPAGNAYLVQCANDVISMMTPSGYLTTVAGNGTAGYSGNGGPATSAQLNQPVGGLVFDASRNMYFIEFGNNVVREVAGIGSPAPSSWLAPTVTSLNPASGGIAGGTSVTIYGTNFHPGATVKFGASSATSVVVNSWGSITCTSPSGSAGAVNVTVTNTDSQQGTLVNGYTYTLTPALVASGASVSPTPAVTLNTTGATLLVAILGSGSVTPTVSDSVGGQSNAWNYLTVQTSTNNKTVLAYAYAASGGGALNVGASHVITPAGTTPSCAVFAFSQTTTTSGVLNASNGAQQQAGTTLQIYALQAGSITPIAGSLVVMGFTNNGTQYASSTIPSGFTGEQKQTNGAAIELVGGCYKLNDAGVAENPSWSVSLNAFTGVVIAAFK